MKNAIAVVMAFLVLALIFYLAARGRIKPVRVLLPLALVVFMLVCTFTGWAAFAADFWQYPAWLGAVPRPDHFACRPTSSWC